MNKNIIVWSLYDFANSIVMIVFLLYFSQWLVVDIGKPDWWYNLTLILSSVMFILTAPLLARRLDISGAKLKGVRIFSSLIAVCYVGTALSMLYLSAIPVFAVVFFTLAMYMYLISFIYYTPMLNDLCHEGNRGWISGLGHGANYLGSVFGLLVTLPFATGAIYLFGAPGRAQTLLPAVALFIIFALPLLISYKSPRAIPSPTTNGLAGGYKDVWETTKRIFSIRNLAFLFLGYFLFSDALLTFSNNFPIFLEKVFLISDDVKAYLMAGILTLSAVGAVVMGKVADKKGSRKTLMAILLLWFIIFPVIAFAPTFKMAAVIMVFAGFFFGPVWAISRAMVSEYAPREIEASSFGFYIVAERFATFIGPIVWSIVLAGTASQGTISYSYAIVSMGILILISFFCVKKIKPVFGL